MTEVLCMLAFALFAEPPGAFARENLVAWCIVPFDAKRRTPEDRAAMLKRLGFTRYAYDWRAEHLPTFEREISALKKNGIELTAVWFPASLDADARRLLDAIARHGVKTQLWVTMSGGGPAKSRDEQRKKVADHVAAIRPIAEAAGKIGCSVGLYNHGGWFGEPENQLAIIDALKLPNVGLVYNQHHGHDHIERFPSLLDKMRPHLYALNLNGMGRDGDKHGRKILPLGQGEVDLALFRTIKASGYRGPIGILGHTDDDAEERLRDNLDGLDWLLLQLDGKPAGVKPKPRTPVASSPSSTPAGAWIADGRQEYRTPPLTIEIRARLRSRNGYNVFVASDSKASAAHWELFTAPGDGRLTAYLPGRKPDHVRSDVEIPVGQWRTVGMQLDAERVRLFLDGKPVADQPIRPERTDVVPGPLAFGRIVEGTIGCDADFAWAKLSRGAAPMTAIERRPTVGPNTVGLWRFDKPGRQVEDLSPLKNSAKVAATPASPSQAITPSPGPHLSPDIAELKTLLVDRSLNDAYMAVKCDGAGRLFVGGREAVFVFEPDGRGGFLPRQRLLKLPQDSIVIGLEYRGDDLYVQTVNALYLVPGGRVKRDGLTLKRLLWGVPQDLHVSFHCLAWGPQGDLYLNHGDPLLNDGDWSRPDHWGHWTLFAGPNGTRVPYTGAGAVLRMRPDGSNLKVVATGLRGPVGLAFNREWELFTNDNDHESRADQYAPAKLLHVVPHADFGWPRGWMASKSPDRQDLLEPVNSTMGRGVPCDQLVYDEPLIPELRDHLLLCRWDRMGVTRFPLKRQGATYRAEELPFLVGDSNARPTGIAVDHTGRLFVTCHYLAGNVVSPHCVSDLVMITRDSPPGEPLGDETIADAAKLMAALAGDSGEARRRAHNELLRRDSNEVQKAIGSSFTPSRDDAVDVHYPWLLPTAFANDARPMLAHLARSPRADVRLQAVRALAELAPEKRFRQTLQDALDDDSTPVRLAALAWFIDADVPPPLDAALLAANDSDLYLRQTAVTLLARKGSVEDFDRFVKSGDAKSRLTGIMAAGVRLTVPPPTEAPPKELPLHYPKGSPFFHRELTFADGSPTVDLADLGRVGSYTAAERWKAVKPTLEQETLFDLLHHGLSDSDDRVKAQSAFYLGLLRDPRTEPVVERVRHELKAGGLSSLSPTPIAAAWTIGPFPSPQPDIETGPIDLGDAQPPAGRKAKWRATKAPEASFNASHGVHYFYLQLRSRSRQTAMLGGSESVVLWHNGRPVAATGGAVFLDLQPGGNDLLARFVGPGPLRLAVRAKERVTVALPEKAEAGLLAERLRQAGGTAKIGPEFLAVDWMKVARVGDAASGRKLFGSLGCSKCHAVTADQAGGGAPSLADAGKRFTPTALVEAILTPDRQVADDYRSTRLLLADGRTVVGLLVKDARGELELLLPDATRRTIKASDVEDRRTVAGSPMPAGVVKTPSELRDLLAYLRSDHPQPP
jgi:putative heme-binding domain-containing protein